MYDIENYLHLVQSVLKRYYNGGYYTAQRLGIEVDDLYQVGCIGLLKASKAYDVEKSNGAKFETYATMKIRSEIQYYCIHHGHSLKYPDAIRRIASKVFQINDEITVPSIMRELKLDPQTANDLYIYIHDKRQHVSLDHTDKNPSTTTTTTTLHELIPHPVAFEEEVHQKLELEERLAILSLKERSVCMMMLTGKTQTEISSLLGVEQSSVSRMVKRSVQKIQKQFT